MDQEIKELIEKSREDFDRDTQRFELLSRNKSFLKELEKTKKKLGDEIFFKVRDIGYMGIMSDLSEKNILLINDYPKTPTYESGGLSWKYLTPDSGIRQKHKFFFDEYIPQWKTFCDRWHIFSKWDGNISSLRENLKGPVELQIINDKEKGVSAIIIRIDNWTICDDIKEIWGEVEKYQNEIWKKEEKRAKFARDLCWYDLSKKHGLKLADIAKIWIDKFPKQIDKLVIRRIKKESNEKDFKGKDFTNEDKLLREVKSGKLGEDYKHYFKEQRDYYISGKSPEGKFYIPFVDTIKKAISRMEKQISQMYYPYNSINFAEELRKIFHEELKKTLKLKDFSLKP